MDHIQRYSTASAGNQSRIAYWNSLMRALLVPLKVTPIGRGDFWAEIEVGRFGPMGIASIRAAASLVDHDIHHVDQTEARTFSLMMCVEGGSGFAGSGKELELAQGDLILFDSQAPTRFRFDSDHRVLSIKIEPRSLGTFLPNPELFLGVPIDHRHHLGRLAGDMLLRIWDQVREGLPEEFANQIRRALLQVVASYFALEQAPQLAKSSRLELRRTAIKRYIDANLTDPGLSAASIGQALRFSKRYIYRAFAAEDESLNHYIQRRRLEQVVHYLASPLWSHWTITEIALHWGFASVPHFSRIFKQRYGQSPGHFRRQGPGLPQVAQSQEI